MIIFLELRRTMRSIEGWDMMMILRIVGTIVNVTGWWDGLVRPLLPEFIWMARGSMLLILLRSIRGVRSHQRRRGGGIIVFLWIKSVIVLLLVMSRRSGVPVVVLPVNLRIPRTRHSRSPTPVAPCCRLGCGLIMVMITAWRSTHLLLLMVVVVSMVIGRGIVIMIV